MNALLKLQKDGRAEYATDDAKWQAIVQNDRNADGKFYYSVKTTGVYCRPSCMTHPALRKNVAFHDTPENAEKAGFRACKRCWPKGPTLAAGHASAVEKACRAIETAEEQPTLKALAKTVGMTAITSIAFSKPTRALRRRNMRWHTVRNGCEKNCPRAAL
jgi:AraC family transcriptional regulator, regulatory protein of adaptative response / methylated-DNA-[protein]-cysteine methyltransferase